MGDTYQPVVILGAPRSGTNMLRDVICSLEGVVTWPCDEINYIWRHGNVRYPSDELPPSKATPKIQSYIKGHFDRIAKRHDASIVVEKTCANTLRVPFVNRILPNAKYIFIHRDGIDATGSAKLRWTAKLDIPYILEKVRYVPLTDLPYYGSRYLWSRLYMMGSADKRLAFWGPALDDMNDILKQNTLNEVCAIQWQRCVESTELALNDIDESQIFRLGYEEFVNDPYRYLMAIIEFMGLSVDSKVAQEAVSAVSSRSVGKGRANLSNAEITTLEKIIGTTLDRYDYREKQS